MSKDNSYDIEFAKRIEKVIEKVGGPSEFAKKTGFALPSLYRWQKGADPSRTNLIKIAECTNTDFTWLATGEIRTQEDHLSPSSEQTKDLIKEGVSMINSYESISVSAGFGSFNDGVTKPDGQEPYSDNLLKSLGIKAEQCAVFWADGDSMYPTIENGDQLLVDLTKKEVKAGRVYLVQNGESVWVKRVKLDWEGIELISDNKEYRPIRISAEHAENLQIIGQVVHIGHRLI